MLEPGSTLDRGAAPVTVAVLADPLVPEGGVVLATVRTRAVRDVVLQGGDVTLAAALSYRYITGGIFGATYSSVARSTIEAARQALPAPTLLRAGQGVEHQVLLTVPAEGLPTVDCELVSIEWTVRATVRFEGRGRLAAAPVALVVLSEGGPEPAEPAPSGRRPLVRLEAVRPRRVGRGSRLTGEVVLAGRRGTAGVRAARVELVLLQVVPHGPLLGDDPARSPYVAEKEDEAVVAKAALALPDAEALTAPGDVRLPFALDVPALPAPTLRTDDFTLRWVVRAVVSRRVAGFPRWARSEVEVVGSTLAPSPGA
jgi:hypothetical protein